MVEKRLEDLKDDLDQCVSALQNLSGYVLVLTKALEEAQGELADIKRFLPHYKGDLACEESEKT